MIALDLADINLKGDNLDGIISEFETKLKQTLDKHTPEVTKKITERKRQPWFDDNIKISRDTCGKERRYGESVSSHITMSQEGRLHQQYHSRK